MALGVAAAVCAAPPFIVLPTMNSVQVRFLAPPTSDIWYEIRHWPDGTVLGRGRAIPDTTATPTFKVPGLSPKLWSPNDPQLYEIEIKDVGKVRFGFRSFEIKDQKFYLNGQAQFLRAVPINPPGRELPEATGKDPEFIRGYLQLLKDAHVNLIRTDTQQWLDACDEIGMMAFQGRYGPIPGTTPEGALPPYDQALGAYRDMFLDLANHPSVVIYVLSNEIPYAKSPGTLEMLTQIREDVRKLDPTRPVIGNAGFGRGKPGEIFDLHPYYGYYGGNMYDWYNLAKYQVMADEAKQPFTLSECVGAYTSDAGVFLTMSKQLATMLRWVGPEADQRTAALEYQAELVRQVVEIPRRMRTEKSGIASVMPFTYFFGWSSAKKVDDLIIKPAFAALRTVFQPVLISAECWKRNLYAGDSLKLRLCVSNDSEEGRALQPSTAEVRIVSTEGKLIASGKASFAAVPYYANAWSELSVTVPKNTPRGDYYVRLSLLENGKQVSQNGFNVFIASRDWPKVTIKQVQVFDQSGKTISALRKLGANVQSVQNLKTLPHIGVLIIGEEALSAANPPGRKAVEAFLDRGGRILCLRQDMAKWKSDWLPAKLVSEQESPFRPMTYAHPMGNNAVIFDGLRERDLHVWNETDRTAEGVPNIGSVVGPLMPVSAADLKNTRIWAVCDQIMRGAAIAEVFHGKGSIILSQFACVDRVDHDPIAAKLLANLVHYATFLHHPESLDLSRRIRMDLEAYRMGLISSTVQGFLPHSPVYQHEGSSKGLQGADHRIDGVTLVGKYSHRAGTGWIDPVPDPKAEGWGIAYGTLTQPATQMKVEVHNPSESPSTIRIRLDDKEIGAPKVVPPGSKTTLEWAIQRKAGPVKIEMRGSQNLVISAMLFEPAH